VELINARYIKPLDPQFVANLSKRFSRIVTLEDNVMTGGFGSSLLEALGQQSYTGDVLCIGIPDEFVEQGRVDILLELLNMETESVVERILCRWPELGSRLTLELRKIGQS